MKERKGIGGLVIVDRYLPTSNRYKTWLIKYYYFVGTEVDYERIRRTLKGN